MGIFEHWPYVNFHNLNLDWIIEKMKTIDERFENAQHYAETATEKAAEAEQSAAAADQSADLAQQSAEAAAQSETNAAESAETAGSAAADAVAPIQSLAQSVSNQINVLTGQMAEFMASHAGPTGKTLLWSGDAYLPGTEIQLSDSVANYTDFIIEASNGSNNWQQIVRPEVLQLVNGASVCLPAQSGVNPVNALRVTRCLLGMDAGSTNVITIRNNNIWDWSGASADAAAGSAVTDQTAGAVVHILRIYGLSNPQNNSEVTDIRVGADGTVYDTAGNAVRSQVSILTDMLSLAGLAYQTVRYDYVSGSYNQQSNRRIFLGDKVPADSLLQSASVYVGTATAASFITCEVWELNSDETEVTRVYTQTVNAPTSNSWQTFNINYQSSAKKMISFYKSGCYIYARNTGVSGIGIYHIDDITSTDLMLSAMTRASAQELAAGFTYVYKENFTAENANILNLDYYNNDAVNKAEIGSIDSTKTVLVFGDSITAGASETSWTYHFKEMTGCTLINKAVAGATYGETTSSTWISTQINGTSETEWSAADIIIIAAGTNDGVHNTPAAEIAEKVQSAIDTIRANSDAPVIFITPIRRNTPTYAENVKLPYISGIITNKAVTNECNVVCGFNFPIPSQTLGQIANLTRDGLHPNAAGANVFARALIGRIQ